MIGAKLTLITQGPDDDTGSIFVPFHHPLHPVQVGGKPNGIAGHLLNGCQGTQSVGVFHAMGLLIAFVHDVQTVLVAQFQKFRMVGVVGSADTVDVMLLHQHDIPDHMVLRRVITEFRMGIVTIDTLQFHRNTVDQQFAQIRYGYSPETDLLADEFSIAGDNHSIEIGFFCRPHQRLAAVFINAAVGGVERDSIRLGFSAEIHFCDDVTSGGIGFDVKIPDVIYRPVQQIHIPENAVEPEKVLTFQITFHVPGINGHSDGILTDMNKIGNLKLGLKVRTPTQAYILTVDVEFKITADTLEYHVQLLKCIHLEAALIDTNGIFGFGVGRIVLEGVVDIGVVNLSVAVGFPTGRHRQGSVEFQFAEIIGNVQGRFQICKIPGSVQIRVLGRCVFIAGSGGCLGSVGNIVSSLRFPTFGYQG